MEFFIDAQALKDTAMTVVKDSRNQPVYILTGRHGIANDGFNLHTIDGRELGEIRQKTVGVSPKYDLLVNRQRVGTIKKMFGMWHEFVFVGGLNWLVLGNMLVNQYHIYHGVKSVTTIASVGTATNTVFKIDIEHTQDIPAGLLIAAILDHWRQVHMANPLVRHNMNMSYGV